MGTESFGNYIGSGQQVSDRDQQQRAQRLFDHPGGDASGPESRRAGFAVRTQYNDIGIDAIGRFNNERKGVPPADLQGGDDIGPVQVSGFLLNQMPFPFPRRWVSSDKRSI
jgi:hypothetical protein